MADKHDERAASLVTKSARWSKLTTAEVAAELRRASADGEARMQKERDACREAWAASQEELRVAQARLAAVTTSIDNAWKWQGGGDDADSLSCPVVMTADDLRSALAAAAAEGEKRGEERGLARQVGYYYCAEHGHEQTEPCPECAKVPRG
jgi:hypothetical protein